jgi:hypothetical protein
MAQIILDSNNNLIQGDFDNATLNNRTKLQTTTTNATTNVYVVPNGSSTSAGVSVANNSSLTNASKIVMATNGSTDTQIISGINGSGTYLPMSFYTNNALAMQIGTNGQVTVAATANPAFSAYLSSNQSITSSTYTKVQCNTEEFDTNSNYNNTNYRFTPTVAGYYQVSGCINFATSVKAEFLTTIFKNGSEFKRGAYVAINTPFGQNCPVSALIYLNGSTDYVELYGYLDGSPSPIFGGNQAITYFQAFLARSA